MSAEEADQHIKCAVGEPVSEGDIVAGPVGFTRRVVRSPHDGKVILAGSGQVLIEVSGQPFQLQAGLCGDVVELIGDRGAILETTGALIQGMWGNGLIDFGLISVQIQKPDQLLTADQLDVSLRGSIVLAAHCNDPEVLKTAEELPLRGLILASMPASLAPIAAKTRIPILLIEGFGQRPMNPVAFKLLTTSERREAALNAETWDTYEGTRPELVITLPGSGALASPRDADMFAPDQQVRVLRAPYLGSVGTIARLKGTVVLPSGLHAPAAEVRLENGESVVLPLANLEILA
jgi:hypothetical protein